MGEYPVLFHCDLKLFLGQNSLREEPQQKEEKLRRVLEDFVGKGPPQTFIGYFFRKNHRLETEFQATGTKKIKENKVRQVNSKSVSMTEIFYVYAFGGGIKKKHSPTLAFETQLVAPLNWQFSNGNVSKLFLLI